MNNMISRRAFIGKVALIALLATPVGRWFYAQWQKAHPPKPDFSRIAVPLTRSIFPNLAAHDLVSVQPMTTPSAMIFYTDFKYKNV